MNFGEKFGIFCLSLLVLVYVYFAFFMNGSLDTNKQLPEIPNENIPDVPVNEPEPQENIQKSEIKTIKIYVTDSKGSLRSVNRKCDTSAEKSCFSYAVSQLIKGPTVYEKKKGLSSEIPAETKILSVREGKNNILIDLSSTFESGGGAESTDIRIRQLIKTVNSNTSLPVFLYINGKQADVIGGEGIMIKQPLSERSLND